MSHREPVSTTGPIPFHKSIVPFLKRIKNWQRLQEIGELILATTIPHEHDNVLVAWSEAAKRCNTHIAIVEQVASHIRDQQARAQHKASGAPANGAEERRPSA